MNTEIDYKACINCSFAKRQYNESMIYCEKKHAMLYKYSVACNLWEDIIDFF